MRVSCRVACTPYAHACVCVCLPLPPPPYAEAQKRRRVAVTLALEHTLTRIARHARNPSPNTSLDVAFEKEKKILGSSIHQGLCAGFETLDR